MSGDALVWSASLPDWAIAHEVFPVECRPPQKSDPRPCAPRESPRPTAAPLDGSITQAPLIPPPSQSPLLPRNGSDWYYTQGEGVTGPVSEASLRQQLAECTLSGGALVWSASLPGWEAAHRVFPGECRPAPAREKRDPGHIVQPPPVPQSPSRADAPRGESVTQAPLIPPPSQPTLLRPSPPAVTAVAGPKRSWWVWLLSLAILLGIGAGGYFAGRTTAPAQPAPPGAQIPEEVRVGSGSAVSPAPAGIESEAREAIRRLYRFADSKSSYFYSACYAETGVKSNGTPRTRESVRADFVDFLAKYQSVSFQPGEITVHPEPGADSVSATFELHYQHVQKTGEVITGSTSKRLVLRRFDTKLLVVAED